MIEARFNPVSRKHLLHHSRTCGSPGHHHGMFQSRLQETPSSSGVMMRREHADWVCFNPVSRKHLLHPLASKFSFVCEHPHFEPLFIGHFRFPTRMSQIQLNPLIIAIASTSKLTHPQHRCSQIGSSFISPWCRFTLLLRASFWLFICKLSPILRSLRAKIKTQS